MLLATVNFEPCWSAFKFPLLDFRPQLEKRSTSPSRKTREKLKAVDSDLETEIEEVRMPRNIHIPCYKTELPTNID